MRKIINEEYCPKLRLADWSLVRGQKGSFYLGLIFGEIGIMVGPMKWINCWAPFFSETIYCEDRYLRDQPSLCQFELSPSDFCLDFCLSVKENF